MKYMFLIYSAENGWERDEWVQCTVDSSALCYEMASKRQFFGASPLHSVKEATTVRVRDGKPLITTGPFAETTEQLGGYYIIDVPHLDAAISYASRLPPAKKGTIEIRPLIELEGLPKPSKEVPASGQKKYLLLSYDDEQYWNEQGEAALKSAMQEAVGLAHEMHRRGHYIAAQPLHQSPSATTVRIRDGKRIVTDGPFAETREIIGGFYLVAANSIEEAAQLAVGHPGLRAGAVEVRQVYDIPPVPIPDATEIMSSRDLNFPREKVFAAFADPECLKKWWGPAGFKNTFHEFDFRMGGHWRLTMHGPDAGNYENHAVFDDIVTPERISWHRLTNPLFQMTMTFAELPKQRTRLVWRMKFDTEDLRDKVAAFAVGKNEENFDRLITELKSRS